MSSWQKHIDPYNVQREKNKPGEETIWSVILIHERNYDQLSTIFLISFLIRGRNSRTRKLLQSVPQ
ncbi:hypothetical protein J22TS3_00230 [Paenibacillus sp. J22TS3]|nr:hypothetical protein J22TS3_00230 [Paenibacillus sp. J22TS3]